MTRAIILAAGQGTRLRPLTDDRPKCLVPFLGKPLLDWQIDTLQSCGVNDIHMVCGYRADQIIKRGLPYTVNDRYDKNNMVESLFYAQDYFIGEGDLLLAYGDIIYQENNLRALLASKDEIAIMCDQNWHAFWSLRFADPLLDAETLKLDPSGLVTELGKKPRTIEEIQGQYTGLIKIHADRIKAFMDFYQKMDRNALYEGKDFSNMYMTSFLQALIDSGWKMRAVMVENGWLEVDSVEDLNTYEQLAKTGQLLPFFKIN